MELIQVGCFEVLEANEWIQSKDLRHVRSFPTTTTGLTEIILCELHTSKMPKLPSFYLMSLSTSK